MRVEHDQEGQASVVWGPKATAAWVAAVLTSLGLSVTGFTTGEGTTRSYVDSVESRLSRDIEDHVRKTDASLEYIVGITEKRGKQIAKNRDTMVGMKEDCASSRALLIGVERDVRRLEQLLLEHLQLSGEKTFGHGHIKKGDTPGG